MIKEGLEIVDQSRKYKIIKKVGQGGQGSVFLAESLINNQQQQQIVALKFTPKIYVSSQETQFLDVLQKYQNSDSERTFPCNIIKIFNYFSYNEYIVTVMEQGQQSLYQYLWAKKGQISMTEQLNLCIDITNSIYFLHQNNIMHRDIKPENFMLVGNKIKLIDFGLLRTPDQRMTIGVGTQMYSAPEIITNQSNYTNSVDIWSLACVFYEIIKQQNLFNNFSQQQIEQQISNHKNNQEIIFNKINNLNCDQDLQQLIKQMLQYDPKKRINSSSVIQFLQQIKIKLQNQLGVNDQIVQVQQQNNQNILKNQNPVPQQFFNKQHQQILDNQLPQQNRLQNIDKQQQQQQQNNLIFENLERSLKLNFEQMLNEKFQEMNLKINNEMKEQINNFMQQQQGEYNNLQKQQVDKIYSINQTIQTNQLDQNNRLDQLEQLIYSQIESQFKQKSENQQIEIQQLKSLIEQIQTQLSNLNEQKVIQDQTLDQRFSQITSDYVTMQQLDNTSKKLSQQQNEVQDQIEKINRLFQNQTEKQIQIEQNLSQTKKDFDLQSNRIQEQIVLKNTQIDEFSVIINQLVNNTQNLLKDPQKLKENSLQSNEQQILQIHKEVQQTQQEILNLNQVYGYIFQQLSQLQQQFQQQEYELKNQTSQIQNQNNLQMYNLSYFHNLIQQQLSIINQQISDLKLQMFDENYKAKIQLIIKDNLETMNLDQKISEIQQNQKDLQQQIVSINNNQENKMDLQILYESYNIKSSLKLFKFQLQNFQEQYLDNKKQFRYYFQPLQNILENVKYDGISQAYIVPFQQYQEFQQYLWQQSNENEKNSQKNNTIKLLKDFKQMIEEFKIIGSKVNEQQALYFLFIFLKEFKKSPQSFTEKLSQVHPNLLNMLKEQIENINNSQLY